MGISLILLNEFMQFFSGNKSAYGVHIYENTEKGKKEEGKNYTQKLNRL